MPLTAVEGQVDDEGCARVGAAFGADGSPVVLDDAVQGITDVVRGQAGGADLDTLFIDEGFGTLDPDTLERDPEVLRDIGRRLGGRLALNAEVVRPGAIRTGDAVRLE